MCVCVCVCGAYTSYKCSIIKQMCIIIYSLVLDKKFRRVCACACTPYKCLCVHVYSLHMCRACKKLTMCCARMDALKLEL